MELKDVEVFKVGTWCDSAGNTRDWTAADLAKIAASYDPANHEAPAVIGHPATNAPAYGWVERFKVVGDRLLADFKDMAEPFVQALKEGLYRKRSISIFPDGRARHVGFLGAAAPAVAGLKDISLADGAGAVTYEFEAPGQDRPGEEGDVNLEQALARIKELESQLADMKAQDQAGQHAAKLKELETQLAAAKADAEKANKEFSEFKAGQAKAAIGKRVEDLVATGRILPREKDQTLAFAESLAKAGTTLDFSADGKTEKVDQGEAFLRGLEGRKENYTNLLGEFATADHAAPGGQTKPLNTKDINKHA